jgi:hypothetical protein
MNNCAFKHAKRCLELTDDHLEFMQDFKIAYSHEALARANALSENLQEAIMYIHKVEISGQAIANEEDRNHPGRF